MTPRLTAFGSRVEVKSEIDMIIQLLSMSHRDYITLDELLEIRHNKLEWERKGENKNAIKYY